jgi:N,N'-diacetyllegionaminate synthase
MKKKIIIIAEIGVNHNGSLSRAKKLIDAAKWSGADYAKFQTYIPEEVFSVNAPKAEYQKLYTNKKETPRSAYEILLLTSFGALGYHLYELATQYDFL